MSEVADNPWEKHKEEQDEEVTKSSDLGDEVEVEEEVSGKVIRGTVTPDTIK